MVTSVDTPTALWIPLWTLPLHYGHLCGHPHCTMDTSVDTPTALWLPLWTLPLHYGYLCGRSHFTMWTPVSIQEGVCVCTQPGGRRDLPMPVMLLIVLCVHALTLGELVAQVSREAGDGSSLRLLLTCKGRGCTHTFPVKPTGVLTLQPSPTGVRLGLPAEPRLLLVTTHLHHTPALRCSTN